MQGLVTHTQAPTQHQRLNHFYLSLSTQLIYVLAALSYPIARNSHISLNCFMPRKNCWISVYFLHADWHKSFPWQPAQQPTTLPCFLMTGKWDGSDGRNSWEALYQNKVTFAKCGRESRTSGWRSIVSNMDFCNFIPYNGWCGYMCMKKNNDITSQVDDLCMKCDYFMYWEENVEVRRHNTTQTLKMIWQHLLCRPLIIILIYISWDTFTTFQKVPCAMGQMFAIHL